MKGILWLFSPPLQVQDSVFLSQRASSLVWLGRCGFLHGLCPRHHIGTPIFGGFCLFFFYEAGFLYRALALELTI